MHGAKLSTVMPRTAASLIVRLTVQRTRPSNTPLPGLANETSKSQVPPQIQVAWLETDLSTFSEFDWPIVIHRIFFGPSNPLTSNRELSLKSTQFENAATLSNRCCSLLTSFLSTLVMETHLVRSQRLCQFGVRAGHRNGEQQSEAR